MLKSYARQPNRHAPNRRGLTLVEALIASVILAVAVIAVSQAVVAGQMQTYAALHHRRATDLAQALLEEIIRLPYDDPNGTSAGESGRSTYDNLSDFNGFSQAAQSLTDAAGAAYESTYQVFSQSASVTSSTQTVTGFGGPINGVTVVITVQDDTGRAWTVDQFIPQPIP